MTVNRNAWRMRMRHALRLTVILASTLAPPSHLRIRAIRFLLSSLETRKRNITISLKHRLIKRFEINSKCRGERISRWPATSLSNEAWEKEVRAKRYPALSLSLSLRFQLGPFRKSIVEILYTGSIYRSKFRICSKISQEGYKKGKPPPRRLSDN